VFPVSHYLRSLGLCTPQAICQNTYIKSGQPVVPVPIILIYMHILKLTGWNVTLKGI